MVTIELTNEQHITLCEAIAAGAFAARNQQLHTMLDFNRQHTSIGNAIERDIDQLSKAVNIVLFAKRSAER